MREIVEFCEEMTELTRLDCFGNLQWVVDYWIQNWVFGPQLLEEQKLTLAFGSIKFRQHV